LYNILVSRTKETARLGLHTAYTVLHTEAQIAVNSFENSACTENLSLIGVFLKVVLLLLTVSTK